MSSAPPPQQTSVHEPPRPPLPGCGCLFLAFLAMAGILAMRAGIDLLQAGKQEAALLPLGLGVALAAVGFGGMLPFRRRRRAVEKQRAAAKVLHDRPWLWREEWVSGVIPTDQKIAQPDPLVLVGFALLLMTFPTQVDLPREVREGNYLYLFYLLLPATGAALMFQGAVAPLLRRWKFGTVAFRMSRTPALLGKTLEGHLVTGTKKVPAGELEVKLSCHETRETAYNWTETEVWSERQTLHGPFRRDAEGRLHPPIRIQLPAQSHAPETREHPSEPVRWKLKVTGRRSFIFHAGFEIPVFHGRPEMDLLPPPAPDATVSPERSDPEPAPAPEPSETERPRAKRKR